MQFNMGLFNKMRSKLIIAYIFFPILFVGIIIILFREQKKVNEINNISTARIEALINRSHSLLGNSLILAEKNANEALRLSQSEKRSKFIVDSWILLGEIQGLHGNNAKALELFIKANELAKNTEYLQGISQTLIETGNIYYTWGDYDKSLHYFQAADTIAAKNSFTQQEIDALNYIGKYYRTKGNFEKSILYFNRTLDISRKLQDFKEIALTLNHIGKYYISEGKLDLALNSYLEACKACEHFEDKVIYAEVCNHLGGLYLQIDQYDKSLEYHRRALACRTVMDTPEGIAKSYNNIGKAYLELKQTDSAFIYFKQSLELCKSVGYKKGTVKALTNLGKVYTIQKKLAKAKECLQQGYDIANEAGYNVGIAESGLALGNYYQCSDQFDNAIFYYQTSLTKITETSFDEIIRDNYFGLYGCYRAKGEYKKAMEYYILLATVEKKVLNVENNRQIALLRISFDTERKEKDNQVLRNANELKEMTIKRKSVFIWLIAVGLISTIILCLLIYGRFINKRKANLKLEKLNQKILRQNAELEKLNKELEIANHEKDKVFSIIAHELRNPLYWFQNLAEVLSKKYQTMSSEMVQKTLVSLDETAKNAFHLMDNLLHWSRSKLNRITPKMGSYLLGSLITETSLMYETIIKYKEISFNINIPENTLIYTDIDLFNCVMRNLLSNAIKYTPTGEKIDINSLENETDITIIVSDTGKGIPREFAEKLFNSKNYVSVPGLMQEKGSGLGLKLCKEFVELNNGKIWVESEPGKGTSFYFTVQKPFRLLTLK